MKMNFLKSIVVLAISVVSFTSCVSEDDTAIPSLNVPIYNEGFETNWDTWTKYSVTGDQVWQLDTQYGNPGSCAKMSGFAGSSNENEDWLISPEIDLSNETSVRLTFQSASSNHSGNILEAKISNNYSGGNPSDATWTTLSATFDISSGSYIWTNSGSIDISSFAGGTVFVAFKYTSTNSASKTWEIDNVMIIKN